jgi:hypothetical protein
MPATSPCATQRARSRCGALRRRARLRRQARRTAHPPLCRRVVRQRERTRSALRRSRAAAAALSDDPSSVEAGGGSSRSQAGEHKHRGQAAGNGTLGYERGSFGSWAISERPLALRPRLAAGVPFRERESLRLSSPFVRETEKFDQGVLRWHGGQGSSTRPDSTCRRPRGPRRARAYAARSPAQLAERDLVVAPVLVALNTGDPAGVELTHDDLDEIELVLVLVRVAHVEDLAGGALRAGVEHHADRPRDVPHGYVRSPELLAEDLRVAIGPEVAGELVDGQGTPASRARSKP